MCEPASDTWQGPSKLAPSLLIAGVAVSLWLQSSLEHLLLCRPWVFPHLCSPSPSLKSRLSSGPSPAAPSTQAVTIPSFQAWPSNRSQKDTSELDPPSGSHGTPSGEEDQPPIDSHRVAWQRSQHWVDEFDWDKINKPNIVFDKRNITGEIFCKHKE